MNLEDYFDMLHKLAEHAQQERGMPPKKSKGRLSKEDDEETDFK